MWNDLDFLQRTSLFCVLIAAAAARSLAQPTAPPTEPRPSAEAAIFAAASLAKAGHLDDALTLFQQIANSPESSAAQKRAAEASWNGLLSRKIEAENYRSSGLTELQNKHFEEAEKLLGTANSIYPDGAIAKSYTHFLVARTRALVSEKRFVEAIATLAKIRDLGYDSRELTDLAAAIEKSQPPFLCDSRTE